MGGKFMLNIFTPVAKHYRVLGGLVLAIAFLLPNVGDAGAPKTPASESAKNANALAAFDEAAVKPRKTYRIAFITECVDNPYCVARINGIKDASNKFGMNYKVFDSQWSLINETNNAQNAVTEGFDGFILGPLAGQPSCATWKRTLQTSGKPVVTVTIPMCGDADYTPGLAAALQVEGPAHYPDLVDHAFASCKTPCKVAQIGGFAGSDLQNYWEAAVKNALPKYPNVQLVVNETANFDPRVALKKTQDALLAHPDITVILSNWDDMSRGIEQAIVASGKKPGTDVRLYSAGATKDGVERIKAGTINASMTLLPYDEGYFGAVALLMALEGKAVNGFVDEAELPVIQKSTGSVIITKENADRYTAKF